MRKLLIRGNSTMPISVGIFNLPPLVTCTPSEWCSEFCYALKRRYKWKTVKDANKWRLNQSKKNNFAQKIMEELYNTPSIKYVRIHISGDFYSKDYIEKWATIANGFPKIIFKTNTKRLDFLKYMKKIFPLNIVARESIDPTRKHRGIFPSASIYGTEGSKKFFRCIDNCEKCNFICWHSSKLEIVSSIIR